MADNLVLARLENGLTARVGAGFAKSHKLELVTEEEAAAKPRKKAASKPRKRASSAAKKTSTAPAEDSTTTASKGSAPSTEEENQ